MRCFTLSLIVAISALGAAPALAQAPRLIPYQGVLEDSGEPITTSTSLVFTLYDAASGGTAVWTETHGLTPGADGGFSVNLGSKTAFTSSVFDSAVWLEVTVGGTALGPRTALGAAPFALGLSLPIRATEASGGYLLDMENSGWGVLRAETSNSSTSAYAIDGRTTAAYGTAIRGYATAATGSAQGLWGLSDADDGTGVFGRATGTTGESIGVDGLAFSSNGYGVRGVVNSPVGGIGVLGSTSGVAGVGVYGKSEYGGSSSVGVTGEASGTTGSTRGVYGIAASTNGRGVNGRATSNSGFTYGIWGESESTSGTAVFGFAQATTGTTYAFRTRVDSPDGYSGYFTGGRGIHVETNDINLQNSALLNEAVVVENDDAVMGLYSSADGGWGSAIALGEVRSDGFDNKWSIARRTGTGGALHFTFGLDANYSSNDTQMRIDTDGTVHADGSFTGGGADFAEYFPLADGASVAPGQVVGLRGGRVSLATDDAEQLMILSSNPAFVGNPDAANGGALVALVGRAEVRLASPADLGDLLVASGLNDGKARGIVATRYDPGTDGPVIGRVLELPGTERAIALVGVDESAALRAVVARQQAILGTQKADIEALRAELNALREVLQPIVAVSATDR